MRLHPHQDCPDSRRSALRITKSAGLLAVSVVGVVRPSSALGRSAAPNAAPPGGGARSSGQRSCGKRLVGEPDENWRRRCCPQALAVRGDDLSWPTPASSEVPRSCIPQDRLWAPVHCPSTFNAAVNVGFLGSGRWLCASSRWDRRARTVRPTRTSQTGFTSAFWRPRPGKRTGRSTALGRQLRRLESGRTHRSQIDLGPALLAELLTPRGPRRSAVVGVGGDRRPRRSIRRGETPIKRLGVPFPETGVREQRLDYTAMG